MNDQEPRRWPGYTEDAYPEVFNTMTAQPKTLKPGQISEEKARQFFDEVLCHLCTQGFIQDFIFAGLKVGPGLPGRRPGTDLFAGSIPGRLFLQL